MTDCLQIFSLYTFESTIIMTEINLVHEWNECGSDCPRS